MDKLPEAEARRDAMVDAETLRMIVRDQPLPLDAWDYLQPDFGALRCAAQLDLWERGIFYSTAETIARDAELAARAAFRAVPGLRG